MPEASFTGNWPLATSSAIQQQILAHYIKSKMPDLPSTDASTSSDTDYDPSLLVHYLTNDPEKADALISQIRKTKCSDLETLDKNGVPPLIHAVLLPDVEHALKAVMLLAEAGTKLNVQDANGDTALHHAYRMRKHIIVEYLVGISVTDIEIQNNHGKKYNELPPLPEITSSLEEMEAELYSEELCDVLLVEESVIKKRHEAEMKPPPPGLNMTRVRPFIRSLSSMKDITTVKDMGAADFKTDFIDRYRARSKDTATQSSNHR